MREDNCLCTLLLTTCKSADSVDSVSQLLSCKLSSVLWCC